MIAPDQRFFLLASPAFDLTLRGDGVFDPFEFLAEHQIDRPPMGSVAAECTGLMLGQSLIEAAAGRADVIGAVGAAQHIEKSVHLPGGSALTARSRPAKSSMISGAARISASSGSGGASSSG